MWTARRTVPSLLRGYAKYGAESEVPHLWKGLVGAWLPFLGSTGVVLRDMSGKGNHGDLTNMAPATDWVATVDRWGNAIYALEFNGSNSFVDTDYDPGAFSALTVSGWIRSYAGTGSPQIIFSDGGTTYTQCHVASANLYFVTNNWTNDININSTGGVWNTWYHVAFVYQGGSYARIYRDAVLVAEDTTNIDASSPDPVALVDIGGKAGASGFNGPIVELCIHNRALPQAEIQELTERPYAMWRRRSRPFGFVAPAVGLSIPVAMHHYLRH